eukprot:SAG31_NODE_4110_length_3573_cov_3.121186_1_plen_129_part_00
MDLQPLVSQVGDRVPWPVLFHGAIPRDITNERLQHTSQRHDTMLGRESALVGRRKSLSPSCGGDQARGCSVVTLVCKVGSAKQLPYLPSLPSPLLNLVSPDHAIRYIDKCQLNLLSIFCHAASITGSP